MLRNKSMPTANAFNSLLAMCVCFTPLPRRSTAGPLTKLAEGHLPVLFVCGEFDRLCPGSRLKETLAEALPAADARVVVLEVSCVQGGKCKMGGSKPAGWRAGRLFAPSRLACCFGCCQ